MPPTGDEAPGASSVHVSRTGSIDIHYQSSLHKNHRHAAATVVTSEDDDHCHRYQHNHHQQQGRSPTIRRSKHSTRGNEKGSALSNHRNKSTRRSLIHERWVIQLVLGCLSAPDVLSSSQVNQKWNQVVDSHFRLWHRLATFYAPRDAELLHSEREVASEHRQLIQILNESCDFLRGVGAPRSAVLTHMRGSSKRLPPSVKLIARLVQLLLTPWHPLPTSYDHRDHFFENITQLLMDVPATHALLLNSHRSFASRKNMLLPLPRKSLKEVLELAKRRQLLASARVPAPYRPLCEWARAMLTCVRAGDQWRTFVVKNFKRPVLGALRRHAGFSSSISSTWTYRSPPPPPPSPPPPPPPESSTSQEVLPGYANTNYQYISAVTADSPSSSSASLATTTKNESALGVEHDSLRLESLLESERQVPESVQSSMFQLLALLDSGRTLYGRPTKTPSGLFDAIDRDGHGFVTRGQIKAAFHRLSVVLTDIQFGEVVALLGSEDRSAGRSQVVISRDSFINGVVRLSWKLRPLSIMSSKYSWRLAGDLAAESDEQNGGGAGSRPSDMSRRVWEAYKPLVRELRGAAKRHRHLFGHVINRMSDYFLAIDVDGDGNITRDEFRSALHRLDMGSFMTREELDKVFDVMDEDRNGTIDREEFARAMQAMMTLGEKDEYARHAKRVEMEGRNSFDDEDENRRGSGSERGRKFGGKSGGNNGRKSDGHPSGTAARKRSPQGGMTPATSSPQSTVFISATRRRSLFDHESRFTVHNSKSTRSGGGTVSRSPPRPAMTRTQQRRRQPESSRSHASRSHMKSGTRGRSISPRKERGSSSPKKARSLAYSTRQSPTQKQQPVLTTARSRKGGSSPTMSEFNHSPNRHESSVVMRRSGRAGGKVAGTASGTAAQQEIYDRLEELRNEHEDRLAEVEQKYREKMRQVAHRVEESNEHHHADLERAMDEMDDMRRRLMQAHEATQAAVHARADQQIAEMQRERIAMEKKYLEEIQQLEGERLTLAEAAGEVGTVRRQLRREQVAYRKLEREHAEEINQLLKERRVAEEVSQDD